MLCLWSVQSDFGALVMVLNLWNGPGFIFEFCGYILMFQLPFSCYYSGLELFSNAYLNTLRTGLLNCLNARSRGLIQSEVRFL